MADIDKKTLEHLAELARLKLDSKEEKKLLKDLEGILNYFKELQELETGEVVPMTGGTNLKNITRKDEINEDRLTAKPSTDDFPEKEGDYLKIPPVFDK